MGIVFEINSLEEMCDLMCGNVVPRQSKQMCGNVIPRQLRKGKTRNGNSERDTRSPASIHNGVCGSVQSSPVECDRSILAVRDGEECNECKEIERDGEEYDEYEEIEHV